MAFEELEKRLNTDPDHILKVNKTFEYLGEQEDSTGLLTFSLYNCKICHSTIVDRTRHYIDCYVIPKYGGKR